MSPNPPREAARPSVPPPGVLAPALAFTNALLALLLVWPGTGLCARSMMNGKDTNLSAQGDGMLSEKRARTPAQKKIDSQLLYAIYRKRGWAKAKGVPAGELGVKFDERGRAIVGIRARVTKAVLARIKKAGGEVISCSEQYNDIQAHVPLLKLEQLAALKDVFAIMPAPEATTDSAPQ